MTSHFLIFTRFSYTPKHSPAALVLNLARRQRVPRGSGVPGGSLIMGMY